MPRGGLTATRNCQDLWIGWFQAASDSALVADVSRGRTDQLFAMEPVRFALKVAMQVT